MSLNNKLFIVINDFNSGSLSNFKKYDICKSIYFFEGSTLFYWHDYNNLNSLDNYTNIKSKLYYNKKIYNNKEYKFRGIYDHTHNNINIINYNY